MHAAPESRLQDLGIVIPPAPKPLGAYVEAVRVGDLLFLSGALPVESGALKFAGRLGAELTIEDGRNACRLAALNALAFAREQLGSLDNIARVVSLRVWLAATPDFRDHPKVADAASELLAQIFGAQNASTRMVAGVSSLPLGATAVLELVLAVSK